MRVFRNLRQALGGLRLNKANTILMMLGIVIGIGSLTVIVAVGEGTKASVMARITDMGFGPDSFLVFAGAGRIFTAKAQMPTNMRWEDVEDIRALPAVRLVVPQQTSSQRAVYQRNTTSTRVYGVTPDWQVMQGWKMRDGAFFTEEDNKRKAKVLVIGATPAKKLFPGEEPMGKMVRIGSVFFKVVAVMEEKGVSESGHDPDDRMMIPLSTSMTRLTRQDYFRNVRVQTFRPEEVLQTMENVRQVLRRNHNLSTLAEDDFRFVTPEGIMEWITQQKQALNRMLVLLSTISLLVGGIVIMNIMLVSIRERVREIGVRRCFGARRSDITQQFLFESVFVSLFGGVVGVLIGWAVSVGLGQAKIMPIRISWEPFALSFVFSTAVGLIFGIQPARKAAQLSPEECIR
jgi:putative ABC transport system permease protein